MPCEAEGFGHPKDKGERSEIRGARGSCNGFVWARRAFDEVNIVIGLPGVFPFRWVVHKESYTLRRMAVIMANVYGAIIAIQSEEEREKFCKLKCQ